VGILPTLAQTDLGLDAMAPLPRYRELNDLLTTLAGGSFRTLIKGLDELQVSHDNVLLEACATSFQAHFQVGPEEFPRLYNLAQVVSAPVLAGAGNAPILLGHRLWHETRIALFEQSLDTRSEAHKARGIRQRVSFGDRWVRASVLEIFREDVAHFRILLTADVHESSLEVLARGEIPQLHALCLHNGTVYRWTRPCYGLVDGRPHLRIELRSLPAGPTVLDQVANAAFYFGLMVSLADDPGDVTTVMSFDDAKENFLAGARYGLKAQFRWFDGETISARSLILERLLPLAHAGLESAGIPAADRDRYLSVVEARVRSGQTGAQWALDSLSALEGLKSRDAQCRALTQAMLTRQRAGRPVHEWTLATEAELTDWREHCRTVGQIMTTDLFTVHPEDLVDVAASLMEWEHIRHVPVEDSDGKLVGFLTHRMLFRYLAHRQAGGGEPAAVREIMHPDPVTTTPETSCLEALQLLRDRRVSGLPVVRGDRLVGIITERDFLSITVRLLEPDSSGATTA
jgi:CBS domain-containing protein